MQKIKRRASATLLWLRSRASFFVFVIIFGILFAKPVFAWGLPSGDDIANLIATVGNLFSGLLAGLIATVIEYLVPVMLYNNFSNAPVVTAGWALMRDTVNMFFVIVLIVIAFGTIFGGSKFKWQTQVPRLLIFAILINFSKTLAGIMIDFGQVVMLTFANALREIAAGNMIEMFGLNKVWSLSSSSGVLNNSGGSGVESWNLAFASIAAVFILSWVLVIMLLMFGILLYRIVALWVLIVLAPLAWFIGGVPIIKSDAYSEWWTNFKCIVAIGPVITFFLWLALAVAGAGSTADGFDTGTVNLGNSASFLTKIFELQNFMSLVVGSAMIMAGMDTAQKICSGIKGKFLGAQLGKAVAAGPAMLGVAKGAALKTAGWTGRKVGAGARAVGRTGAREIGGRMENNKYTGLLTQRGRARAWQKVAGAAGTGVIGQTLGVVAERQAQASLGSRHAEVAKAGEKYKDDTKATKLKQLERFAQSGTITLGGRFEAEALMKDALGDEEMQKELAKSGNLQKLWGRYGKSMEEDFKGDAKTTDSLEKFKKKYAHVTGSAGLLKDKDDVKALESSALLNDDVRKKLSGLDVKVEVQEEEEVVGKDGKKKKIKKKVEKTMTAAEAIEQGHFGDDKKKVWQERFAGVKDEDLRTVTVKDAVSAGSDSAQRVASIAIKDGDLKRASAAISAMTAQYTAAPKQGQTVAQKDEERFHTLKALDKLENQLKTVIDQTKAQGKAPIKETEALVNMRLQRSQAQENASTASLDGKFGRVPQVSKQEKPVDFVRENFANASEERITNAKNQLNSQLNIKESERSAALRELNAQVQTLERDLSNESSRGADLSELSTIRRNIESLKNRKEELKAEDAVGITTEVKALREKANQLDTEVEKIDVAKRELDNLSPKKKA
ncbi:hypothetical protein HY771_03565 [Candidatus Uhrbacteria bacterium]|nr:hypothetical protein [Candidatus Uhrbacteria bacterium]